MLPWANPQVRTTLLNAMHSKIDDVPTGRVVSADSDSENEVMRLKSTALGTSASMYHIVEYTTPKD